MLFPFQDQFKRLGKIIEIDGIPLIEADDSVFHLSQNRSILDMEYKDAMEKIQGLSRDELCSLVAGTWCALSGQEWNSDTCTIIAEAFEARGLEPQDVTYKF